MNLENAAAASLSFLRMRRHSEVSGEVSGDVSFKQQFSCFKIWLVLAFISLAASVVPSRAQQFNVEEFFDGQVVLRGDLWIAGRGTRKIAVDINGKWNGRELVLYEEYKTSEGTSGKQTWKLVKTGANKFVGSRTNLIGKASLTVHGDRTLRLYTSLENFKGQQVPVYFIDRMTLFPDGIVRCVSMGFLAGIPVTRALVYMAKRSQSDLLASYTEK